MSEPVMFGMVVTIATCCILAIGDCIFMYVFKSTLLQDRNAWVEQQSCVYMASVVYLCQICGFTLCGTEVPVTDIALPVTLYNKVVL